MDGQCTLSPKTAQWIWSDGYRVNTCTQTHYTCKHADICMRAYLHEAKLANVYMKVHAFPFTGTSYHTHCVTTYSHDVRANQRTVRPLIQQRRTSKSAYKQRRRPSNREDVDALQLHRTRHTSARHSSNIPRCPSHIAVCSHDVILLSKSRKIVPANQRSLWPLTATT